MFRYMRFICDFDGAHFLWLAMGTLILRVCVLYQAQYRFENTGLFRRIFCLPVHFHDTQALFFSKCLDRFLLVICRPLHFFQFVGLLIFHLYVRNYPHLRALSFVNLFICGSLISGLHLLQALSFMWLLFCWPSS